MKKEKYKYQRWAKFSTLFLFYLYLEQIYGFLRPVDFDILGYLMTGFGALAILAVSILYLLVGIPLWYYGFKFGKE